MQKEKVDFNFRINNGLRLRQELHHKFGMNNVSVIDNNNFTGTIGQDRYSIYYNPGDSLVLYVPIKKTNNQEDLVEYLSKTMAGKSPICHYDMSMEGFGQTHVFEWDIRDPKERLLTILSGGAHHRGTVLKNISVDGKIIATVEGKLETIKVSSLNLKK